MPEGTPLIKLSNTRRYGARIVLSGATISDAMVEALPDLTCVIVPIGGGGLISGTAIALKETRPDIRVIGVEAEAAASALLSREAHTLVHIESAETIADGIAVKRIGERTYPLIE